MSDYSSSLLNLVVLLGLRVQAYVFFLEFPKVE